MLIGIVTVGIARKGNYRKSIDDRKWMLCPEIYNCGFLLGARALRKLGIFATT